LRRINLMAPEAGRILTKPAMADPLRASRIGAGSGPAECADRRPSAGRI
jgi:hypothetical protein